MTIAAVRVVALAIAVLAVVDPAITTSRANRPLVALDSSDPERNGALLARLERELARDYTVVRGRLGRGAATVLVGTGLPDEFPQSPLAAVVPARRPSLRVTSVSMPRTAPVDVRVPVDVDIEAHGLPGTRIDILLRDGDLTLDERTVAVSSGDSTLRAGLTLVTASAGPRLLTVVARAASESLADSATTVVDVREGRWNVLFFDTRASWMATFVRRALEADPRFRVSHRLETSRGVVNTSGSVPVSLANAGGLERYEVIVVGAPEQLTSADQLGLEAFLRRRGGSVVLLMDQAESYPSQRLTGVPSWRSARTSEPIAIGAGEGALLGRDHVSPSALPIGAEVIAAGPGGATPIWSVPVGVGQLVVSGALDTWQHRDPGTSDFNRFWASIAAALSVRAIPPLAAYVTHQSLSPGQSVSVHATVRDIVLAGHGSAAVSALLIGDVDSTSIRLLPGSAPGVFAGTLVAPRRPGTYRLVTSLGQYRVESAVVVTPAARKAAEDRTALVSAVVSSRGGVVVDESDVALLRTWLATAIPRVSRVEAWYPMRSTWWLIPFVVFLGAEWWWRRRRGLA